MRLTLLVLALLLPGCGSVTDAEKVAMMEANRAAILADLFRQQAECQAVAIEFSDRRIIEACVETYRSSAESAAIVIAEIDRRIAEVRAKK